ncbi:hypothetical protein LENED_001807 [Lentinula edodes]|uniref:Uncharacterized protein n=1 Tax=Lentinula edodes TaxID=5353 RepID=A0A1Q3DZE1_LENED|nr:hypothetical protein LENED_001807 [Lentinula edodes]
MDQSFRSAFGHILPHQSANQALYFMTPFTFIKSSMAIDADQEQVGGTGDMWKENPGLFFVQSVALARSRTDDDKAKETLSRIINDKNIDKGSQGMILLVKSKIYLSQVLRRLGEEQDAQSHEQWLIKWLKENPHRLPDSTLVEIFTTDTNIKEDPILTESVGTVKHANLKSSCLNVRCRHIFYCSPFSRSTTYLTQASGVNQRSLQRTRNRVEKNREPSSAQSPPRK